MLKAIIVDDEKWARKIIRNFGKWDEHGIKLVGEAENGIQGLKLVEAHMPDIVITDMEMSNMDGVCFLKNLDQKEYLFKVIVISGHNNFEYAKQAIHSKVVDYILKPIDAEEINVALAVCVKELVQHMDIAYLVSKGLLEDNVVESIIEEIKQFRLSLKYTNIDVIFESLKKIKKLVNRSVNSQLVQIKLLDEYVGSVIKEELYDELKNCDEVMAYYKKYKEDILSGITVEKYIDSTASLIEFSIEHRIRHLRNYQKSVAVLAKDYADSMYREDISLSVIAERLHVSKEYLSKTFKNKYEVTLGRYILDLKMKEAKELLEKKVPHKEVSTSLGYKNLSYFYKVFRKYYNHTPKEYNQ